MKLNENAKVFFCGKAAEDISATTVLSISAHQDDIEMMSFSGIAECYGKKDKWFTGVVVTDGAGSRRGGLYADYTNEEMTAAREAEQNAAAVLGGYLAQFQLKYTSSAVKDPADLRAVDDLAEIILAAKPEVIMTHNPADRHDTHAAVALRVIAALRRLRGQYRPQKFYGMEVWGSLDWCGDKLLFDTSPHPNLAAACLGVYDSQICGGKRYDLASLGRRIANAVFHESRSEDDPDSGSFGIDMTCLIGGGDVREFICGKIDDFKNNVDEKLARLEGAARE
jgi:LmbE family N-acetylglucosaminyl deacetylase